MRTCCLGGQWEARLTFGHIDADHWNWNIDLLQNLNIFRCLLIKYDSNIFKAVNWKKIFAYIKKIYAYIKMLYTNLALHILIITASSLLYPWSHPWSVQCILTGKWKPVDLVENLDRLSSTSMKITEIEISVMHLFNVRYFETFAITFHRIHFS